MLPASIVFGPARTARGVDFLCTLAAGEELSGQAALGIRGSMAKLERTGSACIGWSAIHPSRQSLISRRLDLVRREPIVSKGARASGMLPSNESCSLRSGGAPFEPVCLRPQLADRAAAWASVSRSARGHGQKRRSDASNASKNEMGSLLIC